MSYHFFWGGPFSQWHKVPFVVDNIVFNCAEQYMMYKKALLFQDIRIAELVLKTKNPKEQKALGRRVANFDVQKWDSVARDIVRLGNYAKFSQNPELKGLLLDTKDDHLVEASPYDRVWGIGLTAEDPRAQDQSQWLGKNWLGQVLMQVREELVLKS